MSLDDIIHHISGMQRLSRLLYKLKLYKIGDNHLHNIRKSTERILERNSETTIKQEKI